MHVRVFVCGHVCVWCVGTCVFGVREAEGKCSSRQEETCKPLFLVVGGGDGGILPARVFFPAKAPPPPPEVGTSDGLLDGPCERR